MISLRNNIWLHQKALILASGSRTRAMLLSSAGINPDIIKPSIDERNLEKQLRSISPSDLASRLASAKAENVGLRYLDRITIGADQVLELNGRILHKPVNINNAQEQLALLQGREHILHSAIAIVGKEKTISIRRSARLTMRQLSSNDISVYLALAGQHCVTSSVGGYQLEGLGIHLFDNIEGDHSTILGLPLIPLLTEFRRMGLLSLA